MSAATTWAGGLSASKRPEPSYPVLPAVDELGRSSVPGIYLVGELAGTPLIKLGLNAAAHAKKLGLTTVVLEAERIAQTVIDMYEGKILFAEPSTVASSSELWFEECTREQLLERWSAQVAELDLDVREHERVVDVRRRGDAFEVESDRQRYRARRVVLAMGKAGNPRKAGVPGEREHAERVHHSLSDPQAVTGKHVLVYGGGDVALEAALALCEDNRVTLVTIDQELTGVGNKSHPLGDWRPMPRRSFSRSFAAPRRLASPSSAGWPA